VSLVLLGDWPTRVAAGDELQVDVDAAPRFRGQVTDLALEWVDGVPQLQVVGAGNLARISRRKVGYGDWPSESWADRVDRVMGEAEWSLYAQDTPRLTGLMVAARAAGETTVNAQLADLAESAGAAICDTPDGTIWIQPLAARQPITSDPAPLEIPPDRVAYAPAWQEILDVVNVVAVAYGPEEDSHTQTSRNEDSVDAYGERTSDVGGTLATEADAGTRGAELVGRRGYPRWVMPGCDVLGVFTPRIGEAVLIASLPAPSPVGSQWGPVVEGWVDQMDGPDWTTSLVLSDPVASGVSLAWMELPPTLIWNELDPAARWEDAYSLDRILP